METHENDGIFPDGNLFFLLLKSLARKGGQSLLILIGCNVKVRPLAALSYEAKQ